MLRWVSITPFGRPVVPEEYGNTTTSAAGSIRTSGGSSSSAIDSSEREPSAVPSIVTRSIGRAVSRIAARALSASAAAATSSLAPESSSWCAISWLVFAGLTGVTAAPSRTIAWNTTPNSGEFGALSATTSPFATPSAARPAAARRTRSSSSPYVSTKPVALSTSAGLPECS